MNWTCIAYSQVMVRLGLGRMLWSIGEVGLLRSGWDWTMFAGYETVGHGWYVVGQGLVRMFLGYQQVVVKQWWSGLIWTVYCRSVVKLGLDRIFLDYGPQQYSDRLAFRQCSNGIKVLMTRF